MTYDWLAAVLAPFAVAPHGNFLPSHIDGPTALALLLEGRFSDYRQYAADEGRFPLRVEDGPPPANAASEGLLVGALAALFLDPRAVDYLQPFLEQGELNEAKTVAILLLGHYYSETDQLAAAVDLLAAVSEQVTSSSSSLDRFLGAVLSLNYSCRLLQKGSIDHAARIASSVLELLDFNASSERAQFSVAIATSRPGVDLKVDLVEHLEVVAQSNAMAAVSWPNAEQLLEIVTRRPTLLQERYERLQFSALVKSSEDRVSASYGNPIARTHRLGYPDSVRTKLSGAVIIASLLGDFISLNEARSLDAYELLSDASSTASDFADALGMLRRAGEHTIIRSICETYRRNGPLEVLRLALEHCSPSDAVPNEGIARLSIIANAAPLMMEPEAAKLTAQLLSWLEVAESVTYNGIPGRFEIWTAIGEILPFASSRMTSDVVDRVLSAARLSADPVSLQRLPGVVRNARWDEVESSVRQSALRDAVGWLRDPDRRALAVTLLECMIRAGDQSAFEGVLRAAAGDIDALLIACLINSGRELPREVVMAATAWLKDQVNRIVDNARSGRFSFGGVDLGLEAAILGARYGADVWDPLLRLLSTKEVSATDRQQTRTWVAFNIRDTPPGFQAELQETPGALAPAYDVMWGDSSTRYDSSADALSMSLGIMKPSAALTCVLKLAGSPDADDRRAAASLVQLAAKSVPLSQLHGICLMLLSDKEAVVAAVAADSLIKLYMTRPNGLRTLTNRLLLDRVRSDGILLPTRLLNSARENVESLQRSFVLALAEAGATHPSVAVQRLAQSLVFP